MNYETDFVTTRMLAPHLRKQGGFEVRELTGVNAETLIVEIPLAILATTENITLSGVQTIDTVTTPENDFILVKDQTAKVQNGLYFAAGGSWTRWDGLRGGMLITVRGGDENDDTVWQCVNESIDFGTTDIEFIQVGAGTATDELVKARSTDTTANYLNDKIGVLRGLAKSILNSGGNEVVQLAMPSGTTKYTLRFNGTNWVADYTVKILTTGNRVQITKNASFTSNLYVENAGTGGTGLTSYVNGDRAIHASVHGTDTRNIVATKSVDNTGVFLECNQDGVTGSLCIIKVDGQILSKYLEGTGKRAVYSDEDGNLVNYVNLLSTSQTSDLSDGTATYQLTDLQFTAEPNKQHIVKFQLHFNTNLTQAIQLILQTADTGLTGTAFIKMATSVAGTMYIHQDTTEIFHDFGYSQNIQLNNIIANVQNYVEIEAVLVPSTNATITLAFSQDVADAVNVVTLKEKSRMVLNR
jgi:hypothetical protein